MRVGNCDIEKKRKKFSTSHKEGVNVSLKQNLEEIGCFTLPSI